MKDVQARAWGAPEEQRSGGLLGVAKRTDSRANPSRVIRQNPLIDVRASTIEITGSGFP
jgi:hypothetical protein